MVERRTGYFSSFDDTKVYYEDRGKGPPVILAYGIACTTNHWHEQIKYFSKKYRIITFDYRGHHNTENPKNRENLSLDGIARDIHELCNHLEIPKASFWGHSFGTQVLIRAIDIYPELFQSLVFINGFSNNPLKGLLGDEGFNTAFGLIREGYSQLPETISYLWKTLNQSRLAMKLTTLAGGFNIRLTNIKDIEIYTKGVANIDIDVFLHLFSQMLSYDGGAVLDRINVPTLIIGGDADKITPLKFQKSMYTKIKGSEMIVIPFGTHCTLLDMPEMVNLKIESFLRTSDY